MAGPRLLWAEQVADLAGVSVETIRKRTSEAKIRRAWDAAHPGSPPTLRPYDMPEPFDHVRRLVPRETGTDGGQLHSTSVLSPRYRVTDINAWLRSRPGKGRGRHNQPKPDGGMS